MALSPPASAQSATTVDALERLQETLELRVDQGQLQVESLRPAVLVSATARSPADQSWFVTRVVTALQAGLGSSAMGPGGLRLCEACMAPRAFVDGSAVSLQTGPIGLDEVVRLDDLYRGDAEAARAAIWVDEQRGGVSIRIVDLHTGAVLFAQNIDPTLTEVKNTARMYTLSEELERRARGDSLTQSFVDVALYPAQHVSLDWTDQWGDTNRNLSGVTISLFDPVFGIGAAHYRVIDVLNVSVGAKLIMSVPTGAVRALGDNNEDVLDPLLTAVGVVRVPFGRSNYGALLTASTNGRIGFGISLMNINLIPVVP